jgi:molecular chaperone Hsp33
LLESHPLRGQHVRLGHAWREARAVRSYPDAVATLLGETLAATALLAATLKFQGKLTLQMKGSGLVSLLVAQCTHEFELRGTASCSENLAAVASFSELVGNGQLVVTIETGQSGGRYQGIVPLRGTSVAACLEDYFLQSEQLPTRMRLCCSTDECSGLLLQKLPAPSAGEVEGAATQAVWEELDQRLNSIGVDALHLSSDTLLPLWMQSHDCRLFTATPIVARCSCSRERVGDVLRSIGETEARSVLQEQGSVTISCDFCGREWRFDAVDVGQLFALGASAGADSALN